MEDHRICTFRRIGQGFCGSVWAAPIDSNEIHAIKRENGGPGRNVYNDYIMHDKILSALPQQSVQIPDCYRYVHRTDYAWWDQRLARFPDRFQVPGNALVTERVPPFPASVRYGIIEKYCPEKLVSSIKVSDADQDCLVRPYLGRSRRQERQTGFHAFSLRNYPLHVDQMEELSLDKAKYARIMAETLAAMYWKAEVDANDVEFVLAPPRRGHRSSSNIHLNGSVSNNVIRSPFLGNHTMWILDFDCCRDMSQDEEGVKQAVAAFYRNDPFFPRPGRDDVRDQQLWKMFRERFLEVSKEIVGAGERAGLPDLWVRLVEENGRMATVLE